MVSKADDEEAPQQGHLNGGATIKPTKPANTAANSSSSSSTCSETSDFESNDSLTNLESHLFVTNEYKYILFI